MSKRPRRCPSGWVDYRDTDFLSKADGHYQGNFLVLLKKAPVEDLEFRDRNQSSKRQKYTRLDISLRESAE